MNKLLLLVAACLCAGHALAQQSGSISSVTVAPSPARVGQPLTVTVAVDGEAPKYCGLRIEYGDSSDDIKIDESNKQFPVVVTHTYAAPGSYVIKARGKTVTNHARCPGVAEATVVVEAAAAQASSSQAAACPDGYTLKGKRGKAGDFTCLARKAAKAPDKVLQCGSGLEYFQS